MRCRDRFRWRDEFGHRRRHDTEDQPYSPSRLYRIPESGLFKGVCAGIAEYFGIDVLIVRIVTVVLLFMFPVGTLIAYFVVYKFVPQRPPITPPSPAEEKFWTGVRTEPDRTLSSLRHRFREMEMRLRAMETYVTSPGFTLSREIDGLDR